MFMKGVDRADQYLAYYSLLRKTVKWTKKVALWLINCSVSIHFWFLKIKEFLVQVAKAWAADTDTDLVQP
jgi:hypothetical protein